MLWGLIVAGSLAIGFLLVFAGLAVCGARSRAFDLATLPQGRGTDRPGVNVHRRWRGLEAGEDSNLQPDRYERDAFQSILNDFGYLRYRSPMDVRV